MARRCRRSRPVGGGGRVCAPLQVEWQRDGAVGGVRLGLRSRFEGGAWRAPTPVLSASTTRCCRRTAAALCSRPAVLGLVCFVLQSPFFSSSTRSREDSVPWDGPWSVANTAGAPCRMFVAPSRGREDPLATKLPCRPRRPRRPATRRRKRFPLSHMPLWSGHPTPRAGAVAQTRSRWSPLLGTCGRWCVHPMMRATDRRMLMPKAPILFRPARPLTTSACLLCPRKAHPRVSLVVPIIGTT